MDGRSGHAFLDGDWTEKRAARRGYEKAASDSRIKLQPDSALLVFPTRNCRWLQLAAGGSWHSCFAAQPVVTYGNGESSEKFLLPLRSALRFRRCRRQTILFGAMASVRQQTMRRLLSPSSRVSRHLTTAQWRPVCISVSAVRAPLRSWPCATCQRFNSSSAATTAASSSSGPSQGPGARHSSPGTTTNAVDYATDDWSNTPSSILAHIGRNLYLDEHHPLAITRALIESCFNAPEYGNYAELDPVVSTRLNFDDLGFPQDHPGRSRTDTYYLNRDTVLRTHTSAHQMKYFQRMLANAADKPQEQGFTVIADVYRRDAVDRSHYPVFHQMEGARLWKRTATPEATAAAINADVAAMPSLDVAVDDPNPPTHPERNPLQAGFHTEPEAAAVAAHLKRSLEALVVRIFAAARTAAAEGSNNGAPPAEEPLKVRWVEAYFPFTSPSWELEVWWEGDWLEVLGCGVVQQPLLAAAGAPDRLGWAFGIGVERIAMLLFGVPDIRLFWSSDRRFRDQFRAGQFSQFVPFSRHPVCYKDVAFWLPRAVADGGQGGEFHENDIMEIVRDVAGTEVEDVALIDEFTHPKSGKKSCCYRINYRSLERTLTNEEVNTMHEEVRQRLVDKTGVELR